MWAETAAIRFSATVMVGKQFATWKARPMPRFMRSTRDSRITSSPSSRTCPESGGKAPLMRLKKVLLPAPLGPITADSEPEGKVIDTSSMAWTPPNALVRFRISSFIATDPARTAG